MTESDLLCFMNKLRSAHRTRTGLVTFDSQQDLECFSYRFVPCTLTNSASYGLSNVTNPIPGRLAILPRFKQTRCILQGDFLKIPDSSIFFRITQNYLSLGLKRRAIYWNTFSCAATLLPDLFEVAQIENSITNFKFQLLR